MGGVLVPVLVALMVTWIRSGHRLGHIGRAPGRAALVGAVALSIFGVALGAATVASVLIHLIGWWLGGPVAVVAIWLLVGRRRTGLAYRVFALLALPTSRWVHPDGQRS
jgi:MFS family permease